MEVHRLRKTNARIRDDYSRLLKRFQESEAHLEQLTRDRVQAEQLKQKDYEYIIKQDRTLEQYKGSYSKMQNKY
jgi:hypothetical protein